MAKLISDLDVFYKHHNSIAESVKQLRDNSMSLNETDVSPILREQRRRSSVVKDNLLSRTEILPVDVFLPNSIIRRSLNGSQEIQPLIVKSKELSDDELIEKILKRFEKEKVEPDSYGTDLKKTSGSFSLLNPKMTMEDKRKARKKMIVDKDKEMKRILRRTSLLTPFNEGRISTSEAIREAIAKSETKQNVLIQPEQFIEHHSPLLTEKPPAELTQSWIRRVSESLSISAKRISELTDKMNENKDRPVTSERPKEKESETPNQVQVPSPPATTKKKEKMTVKKKSSLKVSKLGSSSFVHPTIHEVDEEGTARRTESRQTQLSCSSSTKGASARSSGSLRRRSSSATGADNIRSVQSGSARMLKRDSVKQLLSTSKEKTSKGTLSDKSSSITKENEESLSRRSSISQKSSIATDRRPSSSSSKHKKSSLKSVPSKQKTEGQVSRTSDSRLSVSRSSSRARSISSDDTDTTTTSLLEDTRDRTSLSSLIDLYYFTPSRKSTIESLELYYEKSLCKKRDEKPQTKYKKHEAKAEGLIRFSGIHQPSNTDQSTAVKQGEEEAKDEQLKNKNEDVTETENKLKKVVSSESKGVIGKLSSEMSFVKQDEVGTEDESLESRKEIGYNLKQDESSESKKIVGKIFSKNFENLINKVSNELRTSFKKQQDRRPSASKTFEGNTKQRRSSGSEKRSSKDRKSGLNLQVKGKGIVQTKRNSKDIKAENKQGTFGGSTNFKKLSLNKTNELQKSPEVLVKRKTLDSDDETIRYLTSKKIISISTMKEIKMKNKKDENNNRISVTKHKPQVEAV